MTTAASMRRTVVSVIPRNTADEILVVHQRNSVGDLVPSCPGGRVEHHETYAAAFARESMEELGVRMVWDVGIPGYRVSLHRGDAVIATTVFEQQCPQLGRRFLPSPGDKVVSAQWLPFEDALQVFLQSTARHIAEPIISYLSGQVRSAHWRYDAVSSHIPMPHSAPSRPSACVPGHFEVRGFHTELLGVPARYLLASSALTAAAAQIAALLEPYDPQSLITPAVGGVALASAVAIRLDLPLAVIERTPDGRYCRSRGAPVAERTALIDSTYHTGTTVQTVQGLVEDMGGMLVAAAVAVKSIVVSGHSPHEVPIPVHALENIVVHSWRPGSCPLCSTGIPLDNHPARHEGNML